MGKELIPPTATNILNIQNIYDKYKETIIRNLKDYFGKAAKPAINNISGERFSLNNYERKLDELAKYLKLFVSDKKAKPFIEDTYNEIQKMIEEVSA